MLSNENYEIIQSCETSDGTKIELIQFKNLSGFSDVKGAENIFYANQSGMRLKMVRINLNNSHLRVKIEAVYYMRGQLEIAISSGGGFLKALSRKVLAGESFFVEELHGKGEIYLRPSFGHFFLHPIEKHEKPVIIDKKLFYAGTSGLEISPLIQKNISSVDLFGGEAFPTKIQGSGVVILYSPVPSIEISKISLNNEKLWVNGNFVLIRTEDIKISTNSGNAELQTIEGSGTVWIAPTQGIYEKLSTIEGIRTLSVPSGSSHAQAEMSSKKQK